MSQIDRAYSEKRDYIRMRMEAKMTLFHDGREIPALCLDLSSTGMQAEANCSLQMGEKIHVEITSDHEKLPGLKAETEVVRVIDLGGGRQSLGLTILSMS